MEEIKLLSDLGLELKFSPQKTSKHREKEETIFMLEILKEKFEQILDLKLLYGIDLDFFINGIMCVNEYFINKIYGETINKIIMWWIYEGYEIDEDYHTLTKTKNRFIKDEGGKIYKVNTPKQLYNFIKKLMKD